MWRWTEQPIGSRSLFRFMSQNPIFGKFWYFVFKPELAKHPVLAQKIKTKTRQTSGSRTRNKYRNLSKIGFRHKNRNSEPLPANQKLFFSNYFNFRDNPKKRLSQNGIRINSCYKPKVWESRFSHVTELRKCLRLRSLSLTICVRVWPMRCIRNNDLDQ